MSNFEFEETKRLGDRPYSAHDISTKDKFKKEPENNKDMMNVNKKKTDPRSLFNKKDITDREKEQVFLQYYDENLKLKTNQTKLEQYIKELKAKLRVLEGEFNVAKKKSEGQEMSNSDLQFIEDLKKENEALKEELKEYYAYKPQSKPSQKTVVKSVAKSTVSAKPQQTVTVPATPEHLRLIDLLKIQLRKAEGEIHNLQQQLAQANGNPTGTNFLQEVHEKNTKLVKLQSRFESIESSFEAQKMMLDQNKKMLDDVNKKLLDEKTKNTELEVQLRSLEMSASLSKDLQQELESVKNEKKVIENKMKALMNSSFLKDIAEKPDSPLRLKELEENLAEVKMRYNELSDAHIQSEKKCIQLEAKLKVVSEDREILLNEKNQLEGALKEREKNINYLDEQLKLFNFGTGRDKDDFLKALGMVKLQGEEPAWKRIEFMESKEIESNDPIVLKKDIARLKSEKIDFAAQLEKTQTLLRTHLDIEHENNIKHGAEIKKLRMQLKAANDRIEELVRLSDLKAKDLRQMALKTGTKLQTFDDDEFSIITESDLQGGENTFDILVKECALTEVAVKNTLKGQITDMRKLQTVVTVDFYNHDTQTSAVMDSLYPNYSFQVAFKVGVDEFLINYMENDSLKIQIFAVTANGMVVLGTCYAPYRELLIKNHDAKYGSSAIVDLNALIYGETKQDIIGTLKLKMRMRHPITEELKWIREKNNLMEEADLFEGAMPSNTVKQLVINVEKATGLKQNSNSFVYYKLFTLKDVYTQTKKGAEPSYDFLTTHNLNYTGNLVTYLESEALEFVVFDESVQYQPNSSMEKKETAFEDVIGRARVPLADLLHNLTIDRKIDILDVRDHKVGSLKIKVFWHDADNEEIVKQAGRLSEAWEEKITRSIAEVISTKAQSLESCFDMLDADGDESLAWEEFKNGMLKTLKVAVQEPELGLYWNRQKLTHSKLSRVDFVKKFAPFVTFEQKKEQEKKKMDSFLMRFDQGLTSKFKNDSYGSFIIKFSQYLKDKGEPIDIGLGKFDSHTSFLSKSQMKDILDSLNLGMRKGEIEELIDYFDFNQKDKISVIEFKAIVRPDLEKEYEKLTQTFTQAEKTEIYKNIARFLFDYMRRHNFTVVQLTRVMDYNGNGVINKSELELFFRNANINLTPREIDAFFDELDPKLKGNISLTQFTKIISPHLKQKPNMTKNIQISLSSIAQYLRKNKIDLITFFDVLDRDKSGFLDRGELTDLIARLGVISSSLELANLLNHFDYSEDGRVSMKEFIDVLEPYVAKSDMKSASMTNVEMTKLQELKNKCKTVIENHLDNLKNAFDTLKTTDDLISVDNFRKVLNIMSVGFMQTEIEMIIENLVQYEGPFINYEKFMSIGFDQKLTLSYFDKSQGFDMTTSQLGDSMDASMKKTDYLFKKLKKIIRENKISTDEIYNLFNSSGSQSVTVTDFKDFFIRMKIGLKEEDLNQMVYLVNKRTDKTTITYGDFLQALNEA